MPPVPNRRPPLLAVAAACLSSIGRPALPPTAAASVAFDRRVASYEPPGAPPAAASTTRALILSSSVFFHNYRHTANALSVYRFLRDHPTRPVPDEDIILMLADDVACDGRNPRPDAVYPKGVRGPNLYRDDGGPPSSVVEVDYRGEDVTPDAVRRVLTGRHEEGTPARRKLALDENTDLLVFLTGHGGDGFFKFRDREELLTEDLVDALREAEALGRYRSVLFVADTCQAFTLLGDRLAGLRRVVAVGSSSKGESSYAYGVDKDLGISPIDRFTRLLVFAVLARIMAETADDLRGVGLDGVFKSLPYGSLGSTVGIGSSDDVDLGRMSIGNYFQGRDVKNDKVEFIGPNSKHILTDTSFERSTATKRIKCMKNYSTFDHTFDEHVEMQLSDSFFVVQVFVILAALVISSMLW